TRYPLEHRGASFKVTEHHVIDGQDQARPVGVAVGRGGRVFTTIAYMAQNEGSPVYRSDLAMITRHDDPEAHPFAAYDALIVAPERLWAEMSDSSWSRRTQAHQELLRRGGELLDHAVAHLALAKDAGPAIEHCIWLAGASGNPAAGAVVRIALGSSDANCRLQAVRVLTEFRDLKATRDEFVVLLDDDDPQVRHAAVLGLFNFDGPVPEVVVQKAARSDDTYLRQTAAFVLSEKASLDELGRLCQNSDEATRLAGTLAAGFRLTLPGATAEVPAELPLDGLPNEEAYLIQFDDAKVDLRTLGRVGNYTVADHWRVGRHNPEQEALFDLLQARLTDEAERVRLQAAHFLSVVNDPRSEPAVAQVIAGTQEQRLLAAPFKPLGKIWTIGPFVDGDERFERVHPPELGPLDVAATYDGAGKRLNWSRLEPTGSHYDLAKAYGPGDDVSYYACTRLESGSRQKIQLLVGSDDGIRVWHNGQPIWTNDIVRGALPFQDSFFVVLNPGSNNFLFRVVNRTGPCGLFVHFRSLTDVVPAHPEKLDIAGLAERLADASNKGGQVPPEFLEVDWTRAAVEGNPAEGRKLFEAAGCIKCHSLGSDAMTVGGPSLADAAKRFTVAYLVESILLPSKQLSPVFRSTQVVTNDGQQYVGLVVGETAEKLELLLTDTKRVALDKAEIEMRAMLDLSPMPQGLLKKPEEMRDILAFLLEGR
ncbi:MAG TPA: HEAT repeat domain-containing protein, partial [Pirellulales bacterium]|nr:HEAT repeat domain-containing protein [Pirellulales bacterium]